MTIAKEGGLPDVSIDLLQRIWANLYFSEAEAGGTFQQTLNDVVDLLAKEGALPNLKTLPDAANIAKD